MVRASGRTSSSTESPSSAAAPDDLRSSRASQMSPSLRADTMVVVACPAPGGSLDVEIVLESACCIVLILIRMNTTQGWSPDSRTMLPGALGSGLRCAMLPVFAWQGAFFPPRLRYFQSRLPTPYGTSSCVRRRGLSLLERRSRLRLAPYMQRQTQLGFHHTSTRTLVGS